MILLDTNVVSVIMLPSPPPMVTDWLNHFDASGLFVSTISLAETAYGINCLPEGRRRDRLQRRFREFLEKGFDQRVLAFNSKAAYAYAEIAAQRKRQGRPLGVLDAQIAAIARANRLRVATRNTRDFEDCGIDLVNPFEAA